MCISRPKVEACDALIVGAGPAGLAAALLLIRREGWNKVIILERRPAIDVEDADKSYVYKIDGRGRRLTDAAGVAAAVEAAGVLAGSVTFTHVLPDGSTTRVSISRKDKNSRQDVWLPRRAFLTALHGGLAEPERDGRVRLITNVRVTDIQLSAAPAKSSGASGVSAPIVVHSLDTTTITTTINATAATSGGKGGVELRAFAPRLLVGADGMHSEVRRALEGQWAPAAGLPPDHYRPVVLDSPAAGGTAPAAQPDLQETFPASADAFAAFARASSGDERRQRDHHRCRGERQQCRHQYHSLRRRQQQYHHLQHRCHARHWCRVCGGGLLSLRDGGYCCCCLRRLLPGFTLVVSVEADSALHDRLHLQLGGCAEGVGQGWW